MNQATSNPSRKRRTPEQWQQVVNDWQQSGQSARAFCTEQSIGYASFCQWRKRLSTSEALNEPEPAPSFVDLGALTEGNGSGGWRIVLSLGNGVELRLSQD